LLENIASLLIKERKNKENFINKTIEIVLQLGYYNQATYELDLPT